jgi:hypothetical protein
MTTPYEDKLRFAGIASHNLITPQTFSYQFRRGLRGRGGLACAVDWCGGKSFTQRKDHTGWGGSRGSWVWPVAGM